MNWSSFVDALSRDVDWSDDDYVSRQASVVEEILASAARHPDLLRERTEQIAADDNLFDQLVPHMNYPRTLMDKFVIHLDPEDRFRVRLHRFWPRRATGDVIEDVHDHKWDMSTVILTGSYTENRFEVTECDEERLTASVRLVETQTREAGTTSSLALRIPHQITNLSMDEPCLTLFVRGPSRLPDARIFDTDKGTFYNTFSPKPQIREGLLHMGRLNGVFHPVFAAR
ncbi:cupin domain-containing protein [Actinacidiphila bryophytorum]|uniref:hypothetical protein n=1 Tax=Actinacidiphila bryophytorum TaxID=1436133 RepID=UPI002176B978|nr:hypothetical protein [Actinacidiphila bryophytorum]UWE08638.1 hypothetical protein NYE86_07825 [Actinacidiphila bryophytorum]